MLWIYSNYLLISTLSRKTIKFHIFSLLIWWSRTDEEKKLTDHADRLLLTHFNMSDLSIFRLISALFIERNQFLDIKLWKKIFAIIFEISFNRISQRLWRKHSGQGLVTSSDSLTKIVLCWAAHLEYTSMFFAAQQSERAHRTFLSTESDNDISMHRKQILGWKTNN